MSTQLSQRQKLLLYLISVAKEIENLYRLHLLTLLLAKRGIDLGYRFLDTGEAVYSPELHRDLKQLIELGLVEEVLVLSRKYHELYDKVYRVTQKGAKLCEEVSREISEDVRKKLSEEVSKFKELEIVDLIELVRSG
ncbi:MAG: hypothetical protein DRJ40_01910 [Thermoprotei archaeon]|nr:MAG: hypothetical protein DRJ40_01910 [Thermoprotei archaeon]